MRRGITTNTVKLWPSVRNLRLNFTDRATRPRVERSVLRATTLIRLCAAGLVLQLTAGCAAPSRRPAVPLSAQNQAGIPGLPAVRTWSTEMIPAFEEEILRVIDRHIAWWQGSGHTGPIPTTFLAVSGGGSNGAFGAGLLCGWTNAGTRPEFTVVSGISTGALIAPFAFLGPAYDEQLRANFTEVSTKDILKKRSLLRGLFGDAMADNAPLARMISRQFDEAVLEAIASEYKKKGRVLLIGTTNLDAERGVVWNMGAIAASDHPKKLELFHQIVLASTAIPAVFPPMMLDVEVDGRPHHEMHVDGGTVREVFLYPPSFVVPVHRGGVERELRAYVIRNSQVGPRWKNVERRTLGIAQRAIDSLVETQGVGNLYEIYVTTLRDGIDFNLAYIPDEFKEKSKEPFDQAYMRKLFDLAYRAAKRGYPWQKTPPGYIPPAGE